MLMPNKALEPTAAGPGGIALAGELGLGIEMSIYSQDAFDGLGDSATEATLAEQGGAA